MRIYLTRIQIDGVETIYYGKSSTYKDQELKIRRSNEMFARFLVWRTGSDLEILLLTIRIPIRKIIFCCRDDDDDDLKNCKKGFIASSSDDPIKGACISLPQSIHSLVSS